MSKKSKPATKPLTGIRVLIGRAKHQAGALSLALRERGAEVIEIPFIEIRKPKSFRPLDAALKNLPTYDWLILTSVNGVEAMWDRMEKLHLPRAGEKREEHDFRGCGKTLSRRRKLPQRLKPSLIPHDLTARLEAAPFQNRSEPEFFRNLFSRAVRPGGTNQAVAAGGLRVAAIGPATRRAIEQRGVKVDVVPKEYVAESVVRSLKSKMKGKRVLLVRAKVARDVIPTELRKAGAQVDVVEAYETVVPQSSRSRLRAVLKNRRPHVVTFTSSSTVSNFVELLGSRRASQLADAVGGQECPPHEPVGGILTASIGPVTSATLRELGLPVDISAKEFTIPGLVEAIVRVFAKGAKSTA